MTDHEKYNVNFFKPLSNHAKANTKLISILVAVWATAVFGFQFLLMFLNEPTPEATYTKFESVWPQVIENTDVDIEVKKDFSKTLLMVLGKNIAVSDQHKSVLKQSLSSTLYSITPDSIRNIYTTTPGVEAVQLAKVTLGLGDSGFDKIMVDLLPTSLVAVDSDQLSPECKAALPAIMELYLVHNQNFLTDFSFLGFPFHYWYTAQFLLIMFVILCLIYALVIDRKNIKHDFVEET